MAAKKHWNIKSTKDVADLAKYMDRYNRTFEFNIRVFMLRITTEVGIPVIDSRYGAGHGDSSSDHTTRLEISAMGGKVVGTLFLEGEDVAFIEFGAGVYYNTAAGTSPHPKGNDLGFTIGSYGQGQGRYDIWTYTDRYGNLQVSYGTEATMPLYTAFEEMAKEIARIFKEVFANV